jgi:hypothetical protein
MNIFENAAVRLRKNGTYTVAAIAVIAILSGCQSVDATKTSSVRGEPVIHPLGGEIQSVKRKPVARWASRKPLVQMSSVTRTTETAYAAFIRPQRARINTPAPVKVSYSLGNGGPFLGHSPWICGPSGFGQRATCRSRY